MMMMMMMMMMMIANGVDGGSDIIHYDGNCNGDGDGDGGDLMKLDRV